MKRIGAALVVVLSLLVVQPSEATPPDFAVTDCPGVSDSVLRLYTAGLGRTADEDGYDFWSEQYQAGNWSLQRAAEHFVVSEEFVASYGSLNNLEFVERLYRNVLGREGEPSGVEFWTGQLDSGARSRAIVLLNFAESPENVELSGTTPPSLGFFNGGLVGPWTCTQQPANDTCDVGPANIPGLLSPLWDITIEIPDSVSETDVRVMFEVLRNGAVIDEWPMEFNTVSTGQRMRGVMVATSDALDDVLGDAQIDELSCRVLGIEGTAAIRDGVDGDLDTANCEAESGDGEFGRFVAADVTVVNTSGAEAFFGGALVVFRIDGFRIAQWWSTFGDVAPGATVSGGLGRLDDEAAGTRYWGIRTDAVPVGIDPRRVTCEVVDLFWRAN